MKPFELPHNHGHQDQMESLYYELASLSRFEAASDIFKALADPTRVRIFWLLCHHEECVINIAALMEMSSPAVSHHLHYLSECGLIESRRDGKEAYYKASDSEASRLLHRVTEQVLDVAATDKATEYTSSQEDVIRKIHDRLVENLSQRITIEELSEEFYINTTTLKNVFKKVYGTSIAEHIKKHRMEHAAYLLKVTGESVSAVAHAVGYESQSRFGAAFKEAYGELPTEYRRSNALPDGSGNDI